MKSESVHPVLGSTSILQPEATVRRFLPPRKILWKNGNVSKEDILLLPGNGEHDLFGASSCILSSDDKTTAAILLDFGKEIHGGIQLVVGYCPDNLPANVRLRFGESASEAMSTIGVKGATNDHAMRDHIVTVPSSGNLEVGNTGFRFVRIDLVDYNREIRLTEARAVFTFRDIPYLGSFLCNDDLLNKIWLTGAYTVHLNMQDYLFDGIKRDRLVWMGDMHPGISTIRAVFGYNDVVPKSLDQVRDLTPVPEYMNGIISYSMWWVIIQRDWYMSTGDLSYLEQQKNYLLKLLEHFSQKVDANGKEDLNDGSRFIDWPGSENTQGINASIQAMLVMTLNAGSELCTILNVPEMVKICDNVVTKLKSYVPDPNGSKQGASLLALSELASAQKMNEEVLSVGGVHNFSTFFGYYMLQAKAKAEDYQGALDAIRSYWGSMINIGATTFWEDFNIDWLINASRIDELVPEGKVDIHGDYGAYCYKGFRHSFCHGWASGPTPWLTEHVLGINVIAPGCKIIKIDPHLGDLKSAEGTFPTPSGIVKVKHTRQDDGKILSAVDAPSDIKIVMSTSGTVTKNYNF